MVEEKNGIPTLYDRGSSGGDDQKVHTLSLSSSFTALFGSLARTIGG